MSGQSRKFLRVDLSKCKTTVETVPEVVVNDFIGGRGFGVDFLYREQRPGVDPLGADNKLLILTGVLAGTSAQSVSRWMACTRSPLTGTYARSVGGGDFGAWLKFAGYDFILIEGKAESPVYLHITPEVSSILKADEVWGLDTVQAQTWLNQRHGTSTRAVCIGPAGENLVKYAAIVSGRRTAGRAGCGTVMGAKKLKAIAITAKRKIELHDPAAFKELVKEQVALYHVSKGFKHHREMGTTDTHDFTNQLGIYPVRNFRYGQQEGFERLSGEEYLKFRIGDFGCYSCAVRCGKRHRVTSGPYAGAQSDGPEYETIWSFSGPVDSTCLEATIAADQLCDDLGLDTISTGGAIGLAYELYEKGVLTREDTDGLELTYGNHAAMMALVHKIALREGIGNLLAEGTVRAAKTIGHGAEALAIHVKGLELPGYDPRGSKSMGYNFATSNVGANHCYGYAGQEVFGRTNPRVVDRFLEAENVDVVIYNQDLNAMSEVGIVCTFASTWDWFQRLFGKMLAASTGTERFADIAYLWKVGERILNLERAFNIREGFRRSQDTLPPRMLGEPLHTGKAPGEGQVVRELDRFLDRYYQARGWTTDGVPSRHKLSELSLDYVLKDID